MTGQLALVAPATLTIDVEGVPIPQGSKKAYIRGKRVVLVEANPELPAWRKTVIARTQARMTVTGWTKLDGMIRLSVDFFMPRPKTISVEERPRPTVPPDGDKLLRAIADSLKLAGAIVDDSRIVSWHADEWYSTTGRCGARIVVSEVR